MPEHTQDDDADLKRLQSEVDKTIQDMDARKKPNEESGLEKSKAFRAVIDFAVGIAVGGFIGYMIDKEFGTSPIWTFVCVIIGMAAGTLNAYRTSQDMGYALGYRIKELDKEKEEKDHG